MGVKCLFRAADTYPDEECIVNNGLGWAARVQNVRQGNAMLKIDGRDEAGNVWELVYFKEKIVLGWLPLQ